LIETTDGIIDLEIVVGRKAEAIPKDYHAKAIGVLLRGSVSDPSD
jgi:hypothetical protein